MSNALDLVPDALRSPRAVGIIAAAVSFLLLARSTLAFQPPTRDIAPSIDELPAGPLADKLKQAYPKDVYPNGTSFNTPWGKVRYWILGAENKGPKVVFIHGLSIPSVVWLKVAPQLAERGYQVLVYDNFGRGYTSAPNVPYSSALYTAQLALILQHAKWDKAKIVGLSMGGGIAAAFAADFAHLVDEHIVLVAPAGLIKPEEIRTTAIITSSALGRQILKSPFSQLFQSLLRPRPAPATSSAASHSAETLVGLQMAALPGYARALSSSFRDGPITGHEWAFIDTARTGVKVLHIHGDNDKIVPFKNTAERISSLIPHSRLVKLQGAGHDLCYDDKYAPQVVEALDNFLRDEK